MNDHPGVNLRFLKKMNENWQKEQVFLGNSSPHCQSHYRSCDRTPHTQPLGNAGAYPPLSLLLYCHYGCITAQKWCCSSTLTALDAYYCLLFSSSCITLLDVPCYLRYPAGCQYLMEPMYVLPSVSCTTSNQAYTASRLQQSAVDVREVKMITVGPHRTWCLSSLFFFFNVFFCFLCPLMLYFQTIFWIDGYGLTSGQRNRGLLHRYALLCPFPPPPSRFGTHD